MTISDLIAQLTRIMKDTSSTIQVRLCSAYNSTENPFDAFEVRKAIDSDTVYLVPSDIWLRSDLKRLAAREARR